MAYSYNVISLKEKALNGWQPKTRLILYYYANI